MEVVAGQLVAGADRGDAAGVVPTPAITLVERSSRFVLLAPLPGRQTAEIARMKLSAMIATLPLELRKSITWDRGSEMAQHARFRTETGIPIYFCDPSRPGSAARTRTPTDCCVSTGPRAPTCATSPTPSATRSP